MGRTTYEKISEKIGEMVNNVKEYLGIIDVDLDEESLADNFTPSELEQKLKQLETLIEEDEHYRSLFITELRKMRKILAAAIKIAIEDNLP